MPLYIPVSTKSSCAIGVCGRCNKKVPYEELRPDGNSPGLRVCKSPGCYDKKDPYRLPARQTENVVLRYPRPDVELVNPDL